MSIDTGFDPTRPESSAPSSTSLKEDPVPHLHVRNDDVGDDAPNPAEEHAQPVEGDRESVEDLAARAFAVDGKARKLIAEHPLRALAAAAVAGFLIGRIVR